MKPTLFVLAAGMGSRYGGLKQLDGLGPNGETIMDYSIFDAIRGGFGKLVFVIRKDFEQDFRDKVLSKYEGHIPTELVFQAIDNLPEGFEVPAERTKPWGTNHAVLMGKDAINEPFAVINADDFYGRDAFAVMGKWLSELPEGCEGKYSMVGFRICNTLSARCLREERPEYAYRRCRAYRNHARRWSYLLQRRRRCMAACWRRDTCFNELLGLYTRLLQTL